MAIKPVTHRIEQHTNVDRADPPAASDVLEYTDPLWAPEPGGGGGGAHDILSATHTDTDAADVPGLGDVLTWDGAEWDAQPAPAGSSTPTLDITAGPFSLSGDLTPAQITADQNDYAPAGLATATVLRLSTDADRTITGLTGGADGRVLLVLNINTADFDIRLPHDSASSAAANRFETPADNVFEIPKRSGVALWYDTTISRWRVVSPFTFSTTVPLDVALAAVAGTSSFQSRRDHVHALANSVVTLAKIANIATARILGRVTAASGVVEELTGTQATTLLDAFTSALKGLAPASGGGATNFLRADGTWAAPAGGGGAPSDAQYLTLAVDAGLSDERVLTAGEGLRLTDAGAGGAATLDLEAIGHTISTGVHTFTNLAAGPTEIANSGRLIVRIANANEVRAVCHVATAGVTGDLKAQYSTDGTTFADLTTLIDLSTTGLKGSTWQAIPGGALGDLIYIRMVAVNGNGTEDPVVRSHMVHFR